MAKNNNMKSIEEISKMNLADIGRDPDDKKDQDYQAGEEGQGGLESGEEPAGGPVGWDMQEKMAEPSGEHYAFDATIGRPELSDFVRNHMIRQPAFILIVLMGIALPIYTFFFQRANMYLSLVFFLVLSIVYPLWQYKKIAAQNLKNPVYENVFHYMVDDKGFHLEAGLRAIDLEWKEFTKLHELKSSYILYTGKKNAYVLPKKDLGSSEERIMTFVRHRLNQV